MKHYQVVAAIIQHQHQYLCVQRGEHPYRYVANKYEFPGGKIEPGETQEQALIREIQEELQMTIEVQELFLTVFHQYPDFAITMYSYLCTTNSLHLQLREHIQHQWLDKKNLIHLDWAAADLPIVEKLAHE